MINWETIGPVLTEAGLKLLGGLAVLVIGLLIVRWLKKLIRRTRLFTKMEPTAAGFLKNLINVLLYALVFLSAAGVLGVPLSLFVTIVSLAGAALSLALQGALSNFIGGIIILVLKPFKAGQYIKVGDTDGTVRQIGMYYTELVTPDGKHISLPNSSLTNTPIVNFSREGTRRQDLIYSVSYTADIESVFSVLQNLADSEPRILRDPAPKVYLSEHGQSSLNFLLRIWCKNDDYWDLRYDLMKNGKLALDKAGIEIPYPQLDVHIK